MEQKELRRQALETRKWSRDGRKNGTVGKASRDVRMQQARRHAGLFQEVRAGAAAGRTKELRPKAEETVEIKMGALGAMETATLNVQQRGDVWRERGMGRSEWE